MGKLFIGTIEVVFESMVMPFLALKIDVPRQLDRLFITVILMTGLFLLSFSPVITMTGFVILVSPVITMTGFVISVSPAITMTGLVISLAPPPL